MKRLALVIPLVFGCIDFGTELNKKLMELDSGAADSGAPDSGTPDSGMPDSGVADAGCLGPDACLVTKFVSGSRMFRVTSGPGDTFIGLSQTITLDNQGIINTIASAYVARNDAGVYKLRDFPRVPLGDGDAGGTDSIQFGDSLGLRGTDLAVTDDYGYASIFDLSSSTVVASTSTCGFTSSEYQGYNGVDWLDDDTALFVGGNMDNVTGAHVCKWVRLSGFTPIDFHATLPAATNPLQAIAIVGGEVFIAGSEGQMFTSYMASLTTPNLWTSASNPSAQYLSVSGSSLDNVWAGGGVSDQGGGGTLLKFDKTTHSWTELGQPSALQNITGDFIFTSVLAVADDSIYAGGNFGNVIHTSDAQSWDFVTLDQVGPSTVIWGLAAHGPHDLALAVEEDLPDGGAEGRLLIYVVP